jgi:hypothetical protein
MTLTIVLCFCDFVPEYRLDIDYMYSNGIPISVETLEPLYRRIMEEYHHLIFDERVITNGVYTYPQLMDKLMELRATNPIPMGSYLAIIEKINSGCPEMCEQIIYEYIMRRMLELNATYVDIIHS